MSLGDRAAALGHAVTVEDDGRRFRLTCACGWRSQINWKRKTAFDRLTEHLGAVVREHGVSQRQNVG